MNCRMHAVLGGCVGVGGQGWLASGWAVKQVGVQTGRIAREIGQAGSLAGEQTALSYTATMADRIQYILLRITSSSIEM